MSALGSYIFTLCALRS